MPDRGATDREVWKGALASSEACLTIEELARLSNGPLLEQSMGRAHLAECPRCQTELAMLKEFQSGATLPEDAAEVSWISAELERRFGRIGIPDPLPSPGSMPDADRSRRWHRLVEPRPVRVAASASAAVLVAIAVGLHFRGAQEPKLSSDPTRGPIVLRSEELLVLGPVGDLKQPPAELRWQATPGATRYRIRVMEVDQHELWQTESSQTSVPLPAAVRATLVPGKTLLWQVTAIDSAQRPVAASQILRFRLAVGSSSPKE